VIRTLVVEDDARVAELHRAHVERMPGFRVAGVAHRATEALEVIDRGEVDLVLLDFYLPDAQGIDVCRALRVRSRRPPDVIAVTAARDLDTVRAAVAHGVIQYLIKPFSLATFQDKLERYANYRRRLGDRTEASQDEIDDLLGALRGSASSTLPKGLSQGTYDLVADALRRAGSELSAHDVAASTGLSRVTARRYLEHMARQGNATLTMRYGSAGRPEHRYRLR
jgi:response regulator of citrate/malate metabolism